MNDPMAPTGYCFGNQDKLEAVFEKLRANAEELNELSFGDAATKIQRAVAEIEHHCEDNFWTRLSRAAHAFMIVRLTLMKHPRVSINHGFGDDDEASLKLSFNIPLGEKLSSDSETVNEFIKRWDPGNAFDKLCLFCQAEPGQPCTGPNPDSDLPVHAIRRFP